MKQHIKYINYLPLFIIVLITVILLFWELGNSPPGLLVDGASLGYNTFSILKTGKDEWGNFLPLLLKSFGDYKPAGYIYFAIPFVKIFGLSPFSIRLVSAIAGLITVISLFSIILKLSKKRQLAIIGSLILSVSPWFINMSRMAWESSLALALLLVGINLFLVRSPLSLALSALMFSLSSYTYVGNKILVPLIIIGLLVYFLSRKEISVKIILFFLFLLLFFNLPAFYGYLNNQGLARFNQISIFSESGSVMYINEQRSFCGLNDNKYLTSICYVLWNKPVVWLTQFTKNYLSHLGPLFLFIEGDKKSFINNPGNGGLYLWLAPFYIWGLFIVFANRQKDISGLILIILLVSPIMPSLAKEPHFVRSYFVLIPVVIVTSIGLMNVFEKIKIRYLIRGSKILFYIFLSYSLFSYLIDYYFIYTKKVMAWDEYYPLALGYLETVEDNYKQIYIDRFTAHPYIFLLFYLKIDPQYVLANIKRKDFEVESIGKYYFSDYSFDDIYCQWIKEGKTSTLWLSKQVDSALNPLKIVTSFNKVHNFAAVYDINKIIENKEKSKNKLPECSVI